MLEFFIVVVGVFVALAAETWWSQREERKFERDLREDMIVEFELNVQILDSDIATNEQAQKSFGVLEGLTDNSLLALTDEEISLRVLPYIDWAGFNPELGSVQALVDSGNIGVISDRQLRLLLARWSGLLEMRRRFNLQAVEFQHREVMPFIANSYADQKWSETERRNLSVLAGHLRSLHWIVLDNQRDLRSAALDIQTYLSDAR